MGLVTGWNAKEPCGEKETDVLDRRRRFGKTVMMRLRKAGCIEIHSKRERTYIQSSQEQAKKSKCIEGCGLCNTRLVDSCKKGSTKSRQKVDKKSRRAEGLNPQPQRAEKIKK